MPNNDATGGEPIELPPYRAVLVVDTKEFGSNSDADQALLADTIPDVLCLAFTQARLPQVWHNALFPHNTGDGFGIVFDTRYVPAVITRFFDTLQNVLAEQDVRLRSHGRQIRMRMRASLNIGPVRNMDPHTTSAPAGAAMITTHRLLDAAVVRDALTRSDPDQTFLSVALSQRVFDDVVAGEYARLPPSRIARSLVQVKEYNGTVYLYVPKPSGELLLQGIGGDGEHEADLDTAKTSQEPSPHGNTTNLMTGTHSGMTIQAGHLHGDVHNGRHS